MLVRKVKIWILKILIAFVP